MVSLTTIQIHNSKVIISLSHSCAGTTCGAVCIVVIRICRRFRLRTGESRFFWCSSVWSGACLRSRDVRLLFRCSGGIDQYTHFDHSFCGRTLMHTSQNIASGEPHARCGFQLPSGAPPHPADFGDCRTTPAGRTAVRVLRLFRLPVARSRRTPGGAIQGLRSLCSSRRLYVCR